MVLNADADAFRRASAQWDRLGRALDERSDALAASVRRLPDVWESGPAATAAMTHCDGLRRELDTGYVPVSTIAQALARHADVVQQLREQAEALVAQGRQAHVMVHSDGSMTMDAGHSNEWTARSMSSLVWQRDELLRRAADADARTATVIAENTAGPAGAPAARVPRGSVPPQGSPPATVKAWWDSLSAAQRRYVVAEYPELVGALDGVPVASRDVANRIMLDREHDVLVDRRSELAARESYIRAMAEQGRGRELYPGLPNPAGAALAELDRINAERAAIDGKLTGIIHLADRLADPDQPRAYLIGFSSAEDGRAIVSIGNPDEAANVVTYVPGTTSDLPGIAADLDRAAVMADDANRYDPSGRQTAGVLWLGYDAPDNPALNAPWPKYAEVGAPELRSFQAGLRETHDGPPSHNVVLGHSYGSTVVGHAAAGGLRADDLIFVGSPGVGVDSAAELHLDGAGDAGAHVWASTAKHDVIRIAGLDDTMAHGENPAGAGFGGRQFASADGTWSDPVGTHSQYWDQGNPARKNIAYIVTGQAR